MDKKFYITGGTLGKKFNHQERPGEVFGWGVGKNFHSPKVFVPWPDAKNEIGHCMTFMLLGGGGGKILLPKNFSWSPREEG